MKLREAVEAWVSSFDSIPQGIIAKLMKHEPEEWREVTVPDVGDRVWVYDMSESGKIVTIRTEFGKDQYWARMSDGRKRRIGGIEDFEVIYDELLPIWGTMWSFKDSVDEYWLEDMDGLKKMSQCGFRIFESDEFGYFFGIDGAGYDFYESHWVPLYKSRGLKWHDPATEVK